METASISKQIYALLGGKLFAQIANAKYFAYGDDYLLFRLVRSGNGANAVKIQRKPLGGYTLEFHFCNGNGCLLKSKFDALESAESLRQIFTLGSGIYLHLN